MFTECAHVCAGDAIKRLTATSLMNFACLSRATSFASAVVVLRI